MPANATVYAKFDFESYGGTGADGITFFLYDGSKAFSVGAYGGSIGYAQKTAARLGVAPEAARAEFLADGARTRRSLHGPS